MSLAGIKAAIFHLLSRCVNHYTMETDAARRLNPHPHQNNMENLEEGSPTDFHKVVLLAAEITKTRKRIFNFLSLLLMWTEDDTGLQ